MSSGFQDRKRAIGACLCATLWWSCAASAQSSNISSINRFAWSENCGYLNFADAGNPRRSQGVVRLTDHLRGYIWCENVGYINVGSGGPYANTSGANFGVNKDPLTGELSGYGWGENVGWINFNGGALTSPAEPARYDSVDRRFKGFVWGENIGWISLNDATKFVGPCTADVNGDGVVSIQDIFDFLNYWFIFDPRADVNRSGSVNVQDIFDFLTAWFGGC